MNVKEKGVRHVKKTWGPVYCGTQILVWTLVWWNFVFNTQVYLGGSGINIFILSGKYQLP